MVKPKRRLTRLALDRVDFCSAPANEGAWVALMKNHGPIRIAKIDAEKRRAFGFANVAMAGGRELVDAQGDVIAPDELEEAAATFRSMQAGVNHQGDAVGEIFESVFLDAEKAAAMGLAGADGFAGWWIGVQLPPGPTWEAVKSGRLGAFSVQGRAQSEKVAAHVTKSAPQLLAEVNATLAELRAARAAREGTPQEADDERLAAHERAMESLPRQGEKPWQHQDRLRAEAAARVKQISEELNRRRMSPST